MKRAFIGGFFALIGSIWALAIAFLASNNLPSSWYTPPGRFLTAVSELNLTAFFVIAVVFFVLGVVLMVVEYFRKDD